MLYEGGKMGETYLFEHCARLVEILANITAVCVRAVTDFSSAELVISLDDISAGSHLVVEVDFHCLAPCDDTFEYGVYLVREICVFERLVPIRCAVCDISDMRHYIVRVRSVKAFENSFEIPLIHVFLRLNKNAILKYTSYPSTQCTEFITTSNGYFTMVS